MKLERLAVNYFIPNDHLSCSHILIHNNSQDIDKISKSVYINLLEHVRQLF